MPIVRRLISGVGLGQLSEMLRDPATVEVVIRPVGSEVELDGARYVVGTQDCWRPASERSTGVTDKGAPGGRR